MSHSASRFVILSLGFLGVVFAGHAAAQSNAGLRIICDGEARNASVTINGKPSGSCPMDIELPAGSIDLQVSKVDANGNNRVYRETFVLAGGAVRRIEVTQQLMKPVFTQTKEQTIAWILSKLRGSYPYSYRLDRSLIRVYDTKINIYSDGIFEVEWKEHWPEYRYATNQKMTYQEWLAAGQPKDGRVYNTRPASVISKSIAVPIYAVNGLRIEQPEADAAFFQIEFMVDGALCAECAYSREAANDSNKIFRTGAKAQTSLTFPFNPPTEENFEERLRNAFLHLKSFYPPPPVKREAF